MAALGAPYRSRRTPSSLLEAYAAELVLLPKVEREAGTELAVRLLRPRGSGAAGIAIGLFALAWNAAVWPYALNGWSQNTVGIRLLLLVFQAAGVLFALIWLIGLGNWLRARRAPSLELSHEPLVPGQAFELKVCRPSTMSERSCRVRLVCKETAHYTTGGDGDRTHHTQERVVHDQTVLHAHRLEDADARAWSCTVAQVPQHAMHSFASTSNRIEWALIVSGELTDGASFEASYPLRVLPVPPGWQP